MSELLKFRIHMIYRADGMTRPLSYSFRHVVAAHSVGEAVALAQNYIGSAYKSGFEVLSWSAENLSLPVVIKYVGGQFADEVDKSE